MVPTSPSPRTPKLKAHGDIQFSMKAKGENVKEDVSSAEEGDLVTVIVTPDEGWVVNEVSGLWYANEAAARGLRRIAASPGTLDMLRDFDLQFVSADPGPTPRPTPSR